MMATLTQVKLTCDLCGNLEDVRTQAIALDGRTYEIDLCQKDGEALNRVTAGYIAKARKVAPRRSRRRNASGPRGATTKPPDSKREPKSSRSQPGGKKTTSRGPAKATAPERQKGILVYGVFPADIEVAAEMPGIGEQPGLLRIVRSDGLAALISEVGSSRPLGTPDDLRTYREILDGTATEVPVVPLRFGTVLASEDAVADELLAVYHDEFAGALEELDGRAELVVKGRYAGQAVTPKREEATRALEVAMQEHCVASFVQEPAHERDGIHVAFLVDVDQESEAERVIGNLAREWEGRIELELLGPMAAYDFVHPRPAPAAGAPAVATE